jgi:protein disulfide-isomerase A1
LNRFLEFPTLSTVSLKTFPEFKESSDVVVVGYVGSKDSGPQGQFELLAKTMHPEYLFGITNDSALAKSEHIDMPGVAIYSTYDGGKHALSLVDDVNEMATALRKSARPLIIDLTFELHDGYLDVSN